MKMYLEEEVDRAIRARFAVKALPPAAVTETLRRVSRDPFLVRLAGYGSVLAVLGALKMAGAYDHQPAQPQPAVRTQAVDSPKM